jgi:CheY-like chemotaxis protein
LNSNQVFTIFTPSLNINHDPALFDVSWCPVRGSGHAQSPLEAAIPFSPSDIPPREAVRVLIVEDEPLIADYMSLVLRALPVRVVGTVRSGSEAVRLAEREPPDVALVDIGLAGAMDGWAVARTLRERFGTCAVFITGQSLSEVGPRAAAFGAAGCLHKPFRAAELVDAVTHAKDRG